MQHDYSDPEYVAFRIWLLEYEAFRFVHGYEPNAEQREKLAGMQREAWDLGCMPVFETPGDREEHGGRTPR